MILVLSTSLSGRLLSRSIKALLHSGAAQSIKRINYVKDYVVVEKKIVKTEQKILFVTYEKDQEKKLFGILSQNIPDKEILSLDSLATETTFQ